MKKYYLNNLGLHFLTMLLCYGLIFILFIIIPAQYNLIYKMVLFIFFISSFFINYFFLKNNYKRFCNYTKKKTVVLAVFFFIIIDVLSGLAKCDFMMGVLASFVASFCALPFGMMFVMFSVLVREKHQHLSKIFYIISILLMFYANFISCIKLFLNFS